MHRCDQIKFESSVSPLEPENVSLFSFSCGLSTGETQITNLEAENLTFSSLQANVGQKTEIPAPLK